MDQINPSYRLLRRAVGILGISLPILIVIGHGHIERAMSYYYYTNMSTVFTGVLITFGLVLFTYRGKVVPGEKFSENRLTNASGFFALIVALVPTQFGQPIQAIYYVHNDPVRGLIHNGSAVIFILLMGIIVLTKFTKAKYFKRFYQVAGWGVIFGLIFTIFSYVYMRVSHHQLFPGAVILGQTIALWAFGAAWLRRGIPHPDAAKQ
ncbi:hypothetical protein [Marinoscillum pacificum]|uniref:hypothetical protein n=1 Tax=Marinoscillum pacificum TaxID=392723 RepID=UPI0021572A88|nr:hypothetical protein [Marinoscillum pacificum]